MTKPSPPLFPLPQKTASFLRTLKVVVLQKPVRRPARILHEDG